MKFLPRKYRESQSDWFGRRSISWSICVVVRRQADQFESQGFVHIIQNCNQGSSAVVSIMAHTLRTSKSLRAPRNQSSIFSSRQRRRLVASVNRKTSDFIPVEWGVAGIWYRPQQMHFFGRNKWWTLRYILYAVSSYNVAWSLVLRLKNSARESWKSRSLENIKPGASFCYKNLFQVFFFFI